MKKSFGIAIIAIILFFAVDYAIGKEPLFPLLKEQEKEQQEITDENNASDMANENSDGVAMAGSEETVTEVTAETVAEVSEQKQETERKTERKHTESRPQQSAPKPQAKPQSRPQEQSTPQAQAKPQSKPQQTAPKPQAKPQTQAITQKPKPKPTTTQATTHKQKGYYVCNGCGYRTLSAKGSDPMHAHLKKQMLAGNMKCSGYHTTWE